MLRIVFLKNRFDKAGWLGPPKNLLAATTAGVVVALLFVRRCGHNWIRFKYIDPVKIMAFLIHDHFWVNFFKEIL